ncbi:tannase/feruloyl esterase family alpha/beta hydrolase [Pseudomonas sp. CCC3.1]|uniref:tannase/feruloyl esterase family alpha/beta hydrolase n=1 Tax=Pseudomonas sp. CCC3.1 TaxID=3048607 RepID=UPI002AC9AD8C|nr:tannase/feruloyl esterase family alpha/beta hydrolase [Pseudomonas sp. CCC3.1]MEB0204553.1 tannase/feruloyl esterase family alpha/beta hydrolase [Pseudomonas sp. CCC3.1]WPX38807.1 tannase/feruloyl esterase family alpha/beta hydrolase [Pseudomonas sp. CCC3.1]
MDMNHQRSVQRLVCRGSAAVIGLLALSMAAGAQAMDACSALAALALPDATITVAETVAGGQYKMPENPLTRLASFSGMNVAGAAENGPNPAFCRIAATLKPSSDSDIKIEVWLPLTGWNGKFLGVGSFGWGGAMMFPTLITGIEQGYATAATDTGHDSSTEEGKGGQFALGHPEKLIDYAWRADHLMTVHAKALIKAYYGESARRSYWIGCSLGGLEGLIEAKRFPDDYDGIVAGAPPNPLVKFNAAQLWPSWLISRSPDAHMTQAKFDMISQAALKACASPIGLKQGFIDDPEHCNFEPEQLLCKGAETPDCLTAAQVKLMKQIYQGPINPRTQEVIFPGPAKGNESVLGEFVDGKPFPVALDLFKYAAFQDPDWDWTTIDWDKTVNEAVSKLGPLLHVDTDLAPFFDRGAKLLLYVGWNDFHNGQELIDYYQSLLRDSGDAARSSARLFLIPGMGHCYGGAGCDTFNKLGYIDSWVEHGVAPQRIVASKIEDGKVVRTRPLCAYPQVARYVGKGDIDNADSYACLDPATSKQ